MIREVMLFACVFAMSAAAPGADTMFDSRPLLGGGPRAAAPLAAGITIAKLLMLTAAAAGVSAPAATLGTLFVALKVAGAGDGSSLGGLHHPGFAGATHSSQPHSSAACKPYRGRPPSHLRGVGRDPLTDRPPEGVPQFAGEVRRARPSVPPSVTGQRSLAATCTADAVEVAALSDAGGRHLLIRGFCAPARRTHVEAGNCIV